MSQPPPADGGTVAHLIPCAVHVPGLQCGAHGRGEDQARIRPHVRRLALGVLKLLVQLERLDNPVECATGAGVRPQGTEWKPPLSFGRAAAFVVPGPRILMGVTFDFPADVV
jgi:hypothetical protein